MSRVELRERVRDSPLRARSLFTVRAAISSARPSEAPCSFSLFLMCSYWRARFVPFFTPRGGILLLLPLPEPSVSRVPRSALSYLPGFLWVSLTIGIQGSRMPTALHARSVHVEEVMGTVASLDVRRAAAPLAEAAFSRVMVWL